MTYAKILSSAVQGVDAYLMHVEIDVDRGLPAFQMVGLPDASVKESRDRVAAALKNSNYRFPAKRVTVNLAPADIPKEGSSFDLPIAVGLLAATAAVEIEHAARFLMVGELALDGTIRPVRGVLPMAVLAHGESDVAGLVVPAENAGEAAVVDGLPVYPVRCLQQVVDFLNGEETIEPYVCNPEEVFRQAGEYRFDFADVKGQEHAKRALEVAAAGSHNVIMIGPPGSGKTMLAQRLTTILPPLSLAESLETTKVHSIAGMLAPAQSLIATRPFRAPHHTISDAGLVGGGRIPSPGEVSLAHNGVLFLDEMPEFSRNVIEVLRQPLESGQVTIARVSSTLTFPARFMLTAAANPCPCGYLGHPKRRCICNENQIQRYFGKISGPLLDRIDIHLEVPAVGYDDLDAPPAGEPSAAVRGRVLEARKMQSARYAGTGFFCNAHIPSNLLEQHAKLTRSARDILRRTVEQLSLSARAWDRIIKIGRTIADLAHSEEIDTEHILEAVQYRSLDRGNVIPTSP